MREKLIALRKQRNKTVSDLAVTFDISESFYYKIEAGIRNPSFNLMKKMSDYFNEDVDEIFFNHKVDSSSIREKSS